MIGYASSTGTKRNLDALRSHGWRLLFTPQSRENPSASGMPYALDNGAWGAFVAGDDFEPEAFRRHVAALADGADWIAIPDIVCGGLASLAFSLSWIDELRRCGPLLLCVQPGIPVEAVRELAQDGVGIFVGGGAEWKERTLPIWGRLAAETGCYLHVGRVNSKRRIKLCALAGADSFDGTSVTRFAVNIHKLDGARRQQTLWSKGEV